MLVLSSSTGGTEFLSGDKLVSSASIAFKDCLLSLKDMQPLRSSELLNDNSDFKVSAYSHTFDVTPLLPLTPSAPKTISLENCESLWQDKKLSHVSNYQFLPPKNKISGAVIRDFPKLQQPAPTKNLRLSSKISAPPAAPRICDKKKYRAPSWTNQPTKGLWCPVAMWALMPLGPPFINEQFT